MRTRMGAGGGGESERPPRMSGTLPGRVDERVEYRWVMDHPFANFDAAAGWALERITDPGERDRLAVIVADLRERLRVNAEQAQAEFLTWLNAAATPAQAEEVYFTQVEANEPFGMRARQVVRHALDQAVDGAPEEELAVPARQVIESVLGYPGDRLSGASRPEYAFTPVEAAEEVAYERLLEREGRAAGHRGLQARLREKAAGVPVPAPVSSPRPLAPPPLAPIAPGRPRAAR